MFWRTGFDCWREKFFPTGRIIPAGEQSISVIYAHLKFHCCWIKTPLLFHGFKSPFTRSIEPSFEIRQIEHAGSMFVPNGIKGGSAITDWNLNPGIQ